MKRSIVILILIYAIVSGCSNSENKESITTGQTLTLDHLIEKASAEVTNIMPKDFMSLMEEGEPFILIDVRTASEHGSGFIPGSMNIPRGVLEFRIDNESVWENEGMYTPVKEDLIIVYCKKGHRGTLAAHTLKQLGFSNVKNIAGGMLEWTQNFPEMIEKAESVGGSAIPAAGGGGGC